MKSINLGIKCPMCGEKQHKDYMFCSKCGLWLSDYIINDEVLCRVDDLFIRNKIRGLWFEHLSENKYKFNETKITKLVSKITRKACALTEYTFAEVEALIRLETYLYRHQYVNIAKDMAALTGEMMLFVASYQDIYEYWQKEAIKADDVTQIKIRISDCLYGVLPDNKIHKHEANKLIKKLRKMKYRG